MKPSTEFLQLCQTHAPKWGLVLGSGLSGITEKLELIASADYSEFDDLPAPKVSGHSGRFLLGRIAGENVLVAAGRVHLYEGHSVHGVTAGIRQMAAAGVKRIILTNAAGTLNPDYPPGSWMLIADHLNLTGASPLTGRPTFLDLSEVYARHLRDTFKSAATALNVPLYSGIYAGVNGPQYETPAEIRMLRILGADVVGMSTVMEAIQARALGMEVVGLSCLTNWAAGMSRSPLSHTEVLETGCNAAEALLQILEQTFRLCSTE